ncbi:MAG: hypothetical protein AB1445_01345 [Bacillota bacterium]
MLPGIGDDHQVQVRRGSTLPGDHASCHEDCIQFERVIVALQEASGYYQGFGSLLRQ